MGAVAPARQGAHMRDRKASGGHMHCTPPERFGGQDDGEGHEYGIGPGVCIRLHFR